ncbi:adenine deaminase Ade [Peptoclostridium acidaminophilum DSM 3953]|uniref:Adenine deaminase n=1 Tax=Peptoclostridium acidaminophilum DSM 3953 TaxID=1286171 RepID=W8U999_PEPAC|nr:adenine deaminase [Peptoclostridium acidaminophilum]AHM57441.1 adenine deaminase Ade [Peptoclostridium acidaminophilum DSM 3953]
MAERLRKIIDAACAREKAQLVLKNCKIVCVFTGEIFEGDIAIEDGVIAGIGSYEGIDEIDFQGMYAAPGLIDSHVHIESSMLTPSGFATAVVPCGTTAVIADPHEIANVCGAEGVRYMLEDGKNAPLDIYIMAPSCVPATSFEDSGAVLGSRELLEIAGYENILGLGEVMDFPAVTCADEEMLRKLELFKCKVIDGHSPGLSGSALNAYIAAGVRTDHECSSADEMKERLRLGMYVHIREGSAARNLGVLIKGVNPGNISRCTFCTDDKHPHELLGEGHIDSIMRKAVATGFNAVDAIRMATINAAQCYGLKNAGAIAPGFKADIVAFADLKDFRAHMVFKEGRLVAKAGKALFEARSSIDESIKGRMNVADFSEADIQIGLESEHVKVIRVIPNSLITETAVRDIELEEGCFKFTGESGILKLAVLERHKGSGMIGLGLVENFGLKNAAIGSTVAHDSHNLIVIGDSDKDIMAAAKELIRCEGGITVFSAGRVLKTLPLPVAGLMSDRGIHEVAADLAEMLRICREHGVAEGMDPFMTLSFLSLPVIPELKLTARGLFDVSRFEFTSVED